VIRLLLRFGVIFAIIIGIFTIFDVSSPLFISLSSISGIIIGFASTEIVTQVIAGLYLITSRPFTVDDLVKIDDVEGLVIEINLNHTVIKQFNNTLCLIPNKKLLESQILNYTLNIKDELEYSQSIVEPNSIHSESKSESESESESTSESKSESKSESTSESKSESKSESTSESESKSESTSESESEFKFFTKKKMVDFLGNITDLITEEKVTQYVFEIEVEFDFDPQEIFAKIDRVCTQFEPKYFLKPKFKIVGFGYRAKIRFWVFAKRSSTIIEMQKDFIQAIAQELYGGSK